MRSPKGSRRSDAKRSRRSRGSRSRARPRAPRKKNATEDALRQPGKVSPCARPPERPGREGTADFVEPLDRVTRFDAEASAVKRLETPSDRRPRRAPGKRSRSRTERKRGRYIQARPARGKPRDVAFDATLRAAAPFQTRRERRARAISIERHDIHDKVRVRRAANLILFTIDCSWSMSATARVRATQEAILSLLADAYQRRDRVGLVTFRGRRARLVLPPT